MGKLKLRRPSVGAVLGLIALIVAVGGNTDAFSAKTVKVVVRKGQIAKGAVTAKSLAPGSVRAGAIAEGSVHAKALAPGAVGPNSIGAGAVGAGALGPDAVTSGALAPGSVYGGALGGVTVHGAALTDKDTVPSNPEWTLSETAVATCGAGEHLLSGGVVFTNAGNREVGVVQSVPYVGAANGWVGQITSNSGGTATAEVQALCLK